MLADTIDLIEDEEDAYTKTYFNPPLSATTNTEIPATVEATGNIGYIPAGTAVSVEYEYLDSKGDKWYHIRAEVGTRILVGNTLASNIDLEPEKPTVQNGEDGITLSVTESEGATYRWQRKVVDADGKESWIDVGEGVLLKIEADKEALLAWYRYVRTLDDVETASAAIRPVNDEWVEWLENNDVTSDMIKRALGAKSLESVVIEDGKLVYARTGEVLATYDAERNLLIDAKWKVPIASVDPETGVITPLPLEEILDLMSGSPQEPEADVQQ